MKKGLYPGSFDPITYGHIDIVERALKIFDRLYVLVSVNPHKKTLFTKEERLWMVKEALKDHNERIEVLTSETLTVKHAKELGASHIVRGLRVLTDFEYEFQMTHANRNLDRTIDTIFFMTDNKYSFLSSTAAKEIARFEGDLSDFAPSFIIERIKGKYRTDKPRD